LFKVIDVDKSEKTVTSTCYDEQRVLDVWTYLITATSFTLN